MATTTPPQRLSDRKIATVLRRKPTEAEIKHAKELSEDIQILILEARETGVLSGGQIARGLAAFGLTETKDALAKAYQQELMRNSIHGESGCPSGFSIARIMYQCCTNENVQPILAQQDLEAQSAPSIMQTFQGKLKELQRSLSVAPSWEGWNGVIGTLDWKTRPFRATPGLMDRKLLLWMEKETSAADSSLFTSFGIWKSPNTATCFALGGAVIFLSAVNQAGSTNIKKTGCIDNPDAGQKGEYCTWNYDTVCGNCAHNFFVSICAIVVAVSLKCFGDYKTAQKATLLLGLAVFIFGNCAGIGTFTGAMGEFFKYYPPGYGVAWFIGAYDVPLAAYTVVYKPRKSFYALFVGETIGFTGVTIALYISQTYAYMTYCAAATTSLFFLLGIHFILNRRKALKKAHLLSDKNAERYKRTWEDLKTSPTFTEDLQQLSSAWSHAMASASNAAKSQPATTFEDVYLEADLINPLLQAKAEEIATRYGGTSHPSPVKTESRALQKVWRTYEGNWRCVCDLARTTLEFSDFAGIAACLRGISEDPEIELLRVHDAKNRMKDSEEVSASGGYRDVQLCARLKTNSASACGVDNHLVEIQLHLSAIYNLKSEGGHKSYVVARNLRGN